MKAIVVQRRKGQEWTCFGGKSWRKQAWENGFGRCVIRKGREKLTSRKELRYKQWLRDENEYILPAHPPSFAYCLSINKYLWHLLCARYWDTTVNKTQSLSLGSLKPSDFRERNIFRVERNRERSLQNKCYTSFWRFLFSSALSNADESHI